MSPQKVEYLVVDDGGEYPGDARELPDARFTRGTDWELEGLAQAAAENDFHDHCGYERYSRGGESYDFEIYVDGKSVGVFGVSCEPVPSFVVTRNKRREVGA